ncbi:hypothetical protein KSS87_014091 [Heliosperma pusillum]|nr:hypothetical protein KSS87_014091 [Heliosperma pusillum]
MHVCSSRTDGSSSDEDSDVEKSNREDERGRTVLAMVGKAIQNNTKIPLDWHPVRKTPCGPNRLKFSNYIGVVVRERVCITYSTWKDVPNSQLDKLYDTIAKGFTVRHDRKKWILSRADDYWRAFKTRLRRLWMYKKSGKLRKRPPWKYNWILQPAWDKFKEMCTTEKFKEISEDSRNRSNLRISSYRGGCLGYQYYEDEIIQEHLKNGRHVDQVPRHELWIRAHSHVKNGDRTFNNPNDSEIAELIDTFKGQVERGETVLEGGRDDILARALKKPEHGGRVRGIGSGITNTEYFGFTKPTPPSQMRGEITGLRSELAMMKNSQQFIMTFMMSLLDKEQMKEFMTGVNQMGTFGVQSGGQFNCFGGHTNDQYDTLDELQGNIGGQFDTTNGRGGGQHSALGGHKNGSFTQLLINGDEGFSQWSKGDDGLYQCFKDLQNPFCKSKSKPHVQEKKHVQEKEQEPEPYVVPWPNNKVVGSDHQQTHHQQIEFHYQNPNTSPSTILSCTMVDETPISLLDLPQGIYDCRLAIEDCKDIKIVADGQVHILGATEVTLNHFTTLSQDYRRVTITNDIVPTAPLPCPNEECTVVCQAKHTFVSWPARLIFPLKKLDKEPANVVAQSPTSQTSATQIYNINDKNRVKVKSSLCKALKKEALMLKKRHGNFIISIPDNVFYHEQEVRFDCEDLLDWCYQKEIGSSHISIFMKYLSESCKKDGVSGICGFCDSNYISPLNPTLQQDRIDYLCRVFGCNGGKNINQLFFAPFHENRHWTLAAISPWNGTVFWLDPSGDDFISEFAQRIINEGIIKFSILHRKDIKKIKKNPEIRWKKIQYFPGTSKTYSQESIDDIKDIWAKYFFSQIEDEEEDSEDNDNMDVPPA